MSAPCPICRSPATTTFRPFCSRRCADLDLGRWLRGGYVLPGQDGEAAEETAGAGGRDAGLLGHDQSDRFDED